MLIRVGEKVHVMYRALYENGNRRHFMGEVMACEGALCRLEGYEFLYAAKRGLFVKKPDRRATVMNLGESGYVVNLIDADVDLTKVDYHYEEGVGLVATDGERFELNINEFGAHG